ncbi:MAG TPA: flagellar hook-length control protein FliK [Caulobacteraceae bacterium]|nr:flagellar hook-length control protein FliK [Caulobacteraceae bacterium]
MGKLTAMVAPADISPVSVGPVIAPTPGLAVAAAASAPIPAAEAQAIAAQVAADVATLTENLPVAPPPSALATMVGEAATRQDSLAPLLADLAIAVTAPDLPAAARATAAQILAAQTPLGADVTAGQLRTAAQGSGVFLEADLAAAVVQGQAPPAAMQQDLKALLLQLAGELAPLLESPPQPRAPAPTSPPRAAAPLRLAEDQPEPPVGGGPTGGQPPARPSLGADAPIATLARTLQQEAQGALARVQLSQAASVEKPGEPTRWMFEVPIATPDGTAIAQFELSRDGHGAATSAAEPSWRARFSVNVAPSGPVHADVMLGNGRARVTLTAEDAAARAALAANQDELAQALADEQLPDVAVRVIGGAPPRPQQPAGQLVDRRS